MCWQERDLCVGKRVIFLLARERERERDLPSGKREREREISGGERERERRPDPAACLRNANTAKIILWVAVRTANSANFSLIKESN